MNIQDRFKDYKTIVIKVGTSTITYPNGNLNFRMIDRLCWMMSDLKNRDKNVVLVSSGAIGVGSKRLGFETRPQLTREKQASAAVGQAILMQIYQSFFNTYTQTVAQILLTKTDFEHGIRRTNTENTFAELISRGIIPIVNANDTTSTYEIEFSDNDRLEANVAALLKADLLILLTDIDALYDSDPRQNPDAKRIKIVEKVTCEIESMAGRAGSKFSVGGMATKISAAKLCAENGVDMVIADGGDAAIIEKVVDGEDVGTLFIGR